GGQPLGVAISHDGTRLYSGNEHGWLDLVHLPTGQIVRRKFATPADEVALTPDQSVVYASLRTAGQIAMLDAHTLESVGTLESGVRTGFGSFGGSVKDLSAIELGAAASRYAVQRSGVPASDFGHVVFGNALQTSADAIYMARHVGLKAGLPIETPAVTVNRLCGSGFEAITQGAQLILLGETEAVLAGGAESMSQAPHVVRGARWGLRLGP